MKGFCDSGLGYNDNVNAGIVGTGVVCALGGSAYLFGRVMLLKKIRLCNPSYVELSIVSPGSGGIFFLKNINSSEVSFLTC